MRKIGIFAGAFDPIHDGHTAVAQQAVKQLELDELAFMVEEKPWGSKTPVSAVHRRTMVDMAIENNPLLSRFETTDERFNLQTTLEQIEKKFGQSELYFVFGADVFMSMNEQQWPGLEKLLKHYIVVFERAGVAEDTITAHAKKLGTVTAIISSPHPEHSSTKVRMKPHEKAIYVTKKVADYSDEKNLYR